MKCLIATPYEPKTQELFVDKQRLNQLKYANNNTNVEFVHALHLTERDTITPGEFSPHAAARNSLLDTYINDTYDYVLWIDSDLVVTPYHLFVRDALLSNPGGVSAPVIVTDTQPWRFYDTTGFVDAKGRHAQHEGPWFTDRGKIIPMQSVGCMYLAPAKPYVEGLRYSHVEGHTEHMSVMREFTKRGIPIRCFTRHVAYHAYLPDYGENWH